VIAVNQDALFVGGHRLYNYTNGAQAWMKPLANGDVAVLLYNKGDNSTWGGGGPPVNVSVTWEELGWSNDDDASTKNGTASVSLRDLWLHEDVVPTNPAVGHTRASQCCHVPRFQDFHCSESIRVGETCSGIEEAAA